MEEAERSSGNDDTPKCFLPHHDVMRESSTTTKLRIVFNGSQKTRAGESLNSSLLVGANLLPTLTDILLRWRIHRFVFITDIEKMYRQILVHTNDRDFQRILWRHNKNEEIKEYRLNTVTYGLACAPFLAIRTLHQLTIDEEAKYPRGAAALRFDCYVDDIVSESHTVPNAVQTQTELRELCLAGGFSLRKWAANCKDVLAGIPQEHQLQEKPHEWEGSSHSTLGLQWHPNQDHFHFAINQIPATELTKRRVLAETARLFDPLGWLAPVVMRAKILIQSTWLKRFDWDSPLPAADARPWQQLFTELPPLESLRMNRWLHTGSTDAHTEIHGFADASKRGYAAVTYLRVSNKNDTILHLLSAKCKVASIKSRCRA